MIIEEYQNVTNNWDSKYKSLTNVALRTDCPVMVLYTKDLNADLSTLHWPQLPINCSSVVQLLFCLSSKTVDFMQVTIKNIED